LESSKDILVFANVKYYQVKLGYVAMMPDFSLSMIPEPDKIKQTKTKCTKWS
jgi:hypothetical protein